MNKSFPILKLPRLALDEILIMMRPFELIQFSMTSSKSRIILKYLLRARVNLKYKLEVSTDNEPKITMIGPDYTFFDCRITSDKLRSEKTEYIENIGGKSDRIWMYSENVLMDWMRLFQIVMELFNFERHNVYFCPETFPDQNKSIIDFIGSQLTSVNACHFYGNIVANQDVEYVLKNIKVPKYLEFTCKLIDNFHLKLTKNLGMICISDGNWFNYNHLIQLKAYEVEISKSEITNVELNAFLIRWMQSECHQDLVHIGISVNDPETVGVIFDLPHEVIDNDVIREGRTARYKVFRIRGGYDIKRIDGTTGTIYFSMFGDQLMFNMIVF
ncbi:hypothetical protein GCK72_016912 [Caenorhabditis remanei]|uniref:F-box domain-containing protein n=1 Tax=Caenorhabditis remanei TaxID=31234 RepID=A0A6A5G6D6_CAERE|nr:hypothetical protein GCK72_016912 [Caenorhabditis remanei]KAF1750363.1 hypothetical protein GCK72_016912 [Caenorhabditis remanei]